MCQSLKVLNLELGIGLQEEWRDSIAQHMNGWLNLYYVLRQRFYDFDALTSSSGRRKGIFIFLKQREKEKEIYQKEKTRERCSPKLWSNRG